MYSKIQITGKIEVVTGMHIGGSGEFSAIGAVDNPVIKDSRSRLPMIPGSSLKGKLRTLLARKYNADAFSSHKYDDIRIKRLFGSSTESKSIIPCRLIFSDAVLESESRDKILESGATGVTEVKFENTINRATGVANPRQIERVVRGAEFPLDIVYDVIDLKEIAEDFEILADGLNLLQYDYIGGNGSRGYGKIKFKDLDMELLFGDIDARILEQCHEYLKDVEK